MATNSNQPLSSVAFEANEGKQDKGRIGPGEVDQNAKGEGGLFTDSLDSEQGKKDEEKYLSVRAISEMSYAEQDKYFEDGLDPQLVLESQKK